MVTILSDGIFIAVYFKVATSYMLRSWKQPLSNVSTGIKHDYLFNLYTWGMFSSCTVCEYEYTTEQVKNVKAMF